MKPLLSGVMMGTAGVGLFSVSVVGLLAATGRLNPEGVKEVPVLNQIVKEEEGEDAEGTAKRGEADAKEATAQKQDTEKKPDGLRKHKRRKEIFSLESFTAPTTKSEIDRFYTETKKGFERLKLEKAALAKRELELSIREDDLEQRRKSVLELMDSVTRALQDLDRRRKAFESDVTVLKQEEQANLKRQGAQLAVMDPKKASQYLLELGPEKEALAVKLLGSMDVEAASRVLEEMEPTKGARLIERATRLLKK